MQTKHKIVLGMALFTGLFSAGYFGYSTYQLQKAHDILAEDLAKTESRNKLLDQKYKEQKAQVGRLQRENFIVKGQERQAKIDLERVETEKKQLQSLKDGIEKKLTQQVTTCETEKNIKEQALKDLETSYQELNNLNRQTNKNLTKREAEVKKLTSDVQFLNEDLRRTTRQSERYREHNHQLSRIAKGLVAQVEKKELGTSILVKEPLIQFERVELEKILQEYLDKIDEEKILN